MKAPLFSIIFVNYHSGDLLTQALSSWRQVFPSERAEYIVINNDVSESTELDILAERGWCQVEHLEENRGFGHAANRGAAQARGRYLIFLNPDTVYVKGSPQDIEALLLRYPHSIGSAVLLDRDEKREAWSLGHFPTLLRLFKKWCGSEERSPLWLHTELVFPDWVSGAVLFIPRALFETLGGFDSRFFLYFEDVDLCQRLKQGGGKVWRTPSMVVRHQGGGSHETERSKKRAYYRSQGQYFRKYRPLLEWMVLRLLQWIYLIRGSYV